MEEEGYDEAGDDDVELLLGVSGFGVWGLGFSVLTEKGSSL